MTKRKGNLDCIEPCIVFRESSDLAQVHKQLSASHKTHDEEDLLIGLEHVTHSNQKGMICF